MQESTQVRARPLSHTRRLARGILYSFLITFIIARIVVLLIQCGRIPYVYLDLGGTHVHHLNYGIFLLAVVGGFMIFCRPTTGWALGVAAVFYGIGLGLTFDEFGMWLRLGGSYWQRASFDSVVIIAGILALIGYAPGWQQMRQSQWAAASALGLALLIFSVLAISSSNWAGHKIAPRFERLERSFLDRSAEEEDDVSRPDAKPAGAHETTNVKSTSTVEFSGSSATPTAARACLPASPKTSTSRSLAPLATLCWSVKPSADAT
jgi:hypothetical protein